ncbi:Protein kinase protein with adenine nucleotide alpha hydrolase-like domain [Forsythia ovata]
MPRLIAVAIDRDKGSQFSLKWAVENLVSKGQTLILIHVKAKQSSPFFALSPSLPLPRPNQISDMDENGSSNGESDAQTKELFLPFHVFCTRKDISCYDVVLEDTDVTKAITEFVKQSGIDVVVLGATVKGSIFRFKAKDIPASVLKGVPDFCTIYIIHKGKISSMRAASRPPPSILSPLRAQIMLHVCSKSDASEPSLFSSNNSRNSFSGQSRPGSEPSPNAMQNEAHFMKYVIISSSKHKIHSAPEYLLGSHSDASFKFSCYSN